MTYDDAMKALKAADAAGNVEDARRLAEIANRLKTQAPQGADPNRFIGQVNKGIANTVGGLVDFINPFDDEVWRDTAVGRSPLGGSARTGIAQGMNAIGADVATAEPDGVVQAAGRGIGEASAALLPVVKGLQALRATGGAVGAFADDAIRALSTWGGVGTEAVAGGISRAAEDGAEQAGAPEWVQQSAAVLAPMSIPAAAMAAGPAVRGGMKLAEKLPITGPVVGAARRLPGQVAAAVAPYTEQGARRIAGDRMVELAGGRERAEELASRTTGENPMNLTPAQMTGDQRMLSLEQTAAAEDAALDARLRARAEGSTAAARSEISGMGGDVEAAQRYFEANRRRFASELTRRADKAIQEATGGVQNIKSTRLTSENSTRVMAAIDNALSEAKMKEADLWGQIPKAITINASQTRANAQALVDDTDWPQEEDIPPQLFKLLEKPETQTIGELQALYSKMREVSRAAMAGNNQQRNVARIATEVANAILEDMGAKADTSFIGRKINEARAFSREMHETFDQGEVGRLLNRTIDGDTTTAPELALDRTVGRGGVSAMVGDRDIAAATSGKSMPFVADYIRGSFNRRSFDAEGKFTSLGARTFLRDNEELLRRYPALRDEIDSAVTDRVSAEEFASRVSTRLDALRSERRSAAERFLNGAPDKAFTSILQDKNPVAAAGRLVNEARKDPNGEALAGLKGAVTEYLTANAFKVQGGRVSGNADAVSNILDNPRALGALRRIFSSDEMRRMERIARDMGMLQESQRAQPSIGGLVDGRANRVVEYLARVVAARQGAAMGGGFAGGMQSAQMASSRMKEALGYLVSDKASQMLADAIEDPELFRALLVEVTPQNEARVLNKVWPYLVGTVTSGTGQEPQ